MTSRRFGFAPDPGGGGAGDVRSANVVLVKATLRPSANFGAPGLWSRVARRGRRALRNCTAIHLLAPYGVGAVNDTRTILGWQPIPCLLQWQMGGRGKASLTFARAARPEGNGVDWQEGENHRCSPSCPQCGRAGHIPTREVRAHLRPVRRTPPGAQCAPLRGSAPRSSRPTKLRGNSPSHALRNMDDTPRRPLISSYVTALAQIRVSDTKKAPERSVPKPFSVMPYAGRNHAGTAFSSRSRSRNTAAAARSYSSAVRDFLSALPCFSLSANRFR